MKRWSARWTILKLFEAGVSVPEIATYFDLNLMTVEAILRRASRKR